MAPKLGARKSKRQDSKTKSNATRDWKPDGPCVFINCGEETYIQPFLFYRGKTLENVRKCNSCKYLDPKSIRKITPRRCSSCHLTGPVSESKRESEKKYKCRQCGEELKKTRFWNSSWWVRFWKRNPER